MNRGLMIFMGLGFLAAHVYLGWGPIKAFSPTYDEPVHLTAGVAALKTGHYNYLGHEHPPFGEMWAALPLLFSNVRIPVQDPSWIDQRWTHLAIYRFADKFIYHNQLSADVIFERARMMQLLLSTLFLILLAYYAFQIGGPGTALATLALGSFSSSLLAHATLVTTDLSFSIFFFLFFASLAVLSSSRGAIVSGLFLGLCAASKFSFLMVVPCAAAVGAWFTLFKKNEVEKYFGKNIFILLGTAFLTLALVYRFENLDTFWKGLTVFGERSQEGRSSFFFGQHGTDGWLAYFPMAFVLKTEIPLLLSLLLAILLILKKKLSISPFFWIPPLVFVAAACFSKVQIGQRHILMAYPFLFLISGLALNAIPPKIKNSVVPLAIVWMGAGAFLIRPNFLSYFNQLAGGSGNGYQYFTDSNVDWGQGLKQLAAGLEPVDRERGIYLCYFGVGDPHQYGIKYWDLASDSFVGHTDDSQDNSLSPTKFAISVTNLQSTYYADKTVFDWLKKETPWKKAGESIFIYDFSNSPEAISKLNSPRSSHASH